MLEQHSALGRKIGETHQISIKYQYFHENDGNSAIFLLFQEKLGNHVFGALPGKEKVVNYENSAFSWKKS